MTSGFTTSRAARMAREKATALAAFAVPNRPVIRTQAELDAYSDWSVPPVLAGDGVFYLPAADFEYVVELRDTVYLDVDDARARILARNDSEVEVRGVDARVCALDRAKVHGSGATVLAFDNSHTDLYHGTVFVEDEATAITGGSTNVVIGGRAFVLAHGVSQVAAFEQARVAVGPTGEADLFAEIDGVERPPRLVVRALGPVRVDVGEGSGACVLLVHDTSATVEASDAPLSWWEATLAQTAEHLRENSLDETEALARLRELGARAARLVAQREAAATWRPLPIRRSRRSGLAS